MKRKLLLIVTILFFSGISSGIYSQTKEKRKKIVEQTSVSYLLDYAKKKSDNYNIIKALALEEAKKNGWITSKEIEGGGYMELQGIDKNGRPLYYITHNEDAAISTSTNKVYSGGELGLDLDGSGMIAGEWDGGDVRTTHQEFNNTGSSRVTDKDGVSSTHYHATHVAGTIIAGGVQTAAKGMAYNANLDAYDWDNDESEMATAAANGLLISNHSYGYIAGWAWNGSSWVWYGDSSISNEEDYRFGFYGSYCVEWDNIANNAPYYLIVKSAGNDQGDWNGYSTLHPKDGGANGYDCISYKGNAKNILTVGAVNDVAGGYTQPSDVTLASFSSTGPCDDSRIKPDIVGNGVNLYSTYDDSDVAYNSISGTSMSSPNVTGSLLLLQEHYSETQSSYMKAATLKALAIHTADECGDNVGPDYKFGWGLLNTAIAANVISNRNTLSLINEEIYDGTSYSLELNATGTEPLVVTIVWSDPAGTPVAAALDPTDIMLVNDLDMSITGDGGPYSPYMLSAANPSAGATTGDNDVDNVEKIYIANPTAGSYTVNISHEGSITGGAQEFSIVVTGISISSDNPLVATTNISLITTSSAQSGGNAINEGASSIIERGIVWGTSINPTTTNNKIVDPGTGIGSYVSDITGLSLFTSYYVRAYAINSNGTSYGSNKRFTTLCDISTIELSETSHNFGNVFQNGTDTDTILISNSGCDTLSISNITSSLSEFTANITTLDILPGDTSEVLLTFAPTTLGNFNATLTIYNNDTDTTINLSGTGVEAPVISVNPTLFDVTMYECNDSVTLPLTIYNTGGDDLTWEIDMGKEYGFESGNLDNWIDDGNYGTKEVTTNTAAKGSYSFHNINSSQGHSHGIHKEFDAGFQPENVSFHIRSGSTTTADAYFAIKTNGGSNSVMFFFASSSGFLYVNEDVGGDESYAYNALQWYHIEFKDIDWVNKNFDYYVDGVLIKSDIPFRNSGSANDVDALYLYNFHSNSEAWWDAINMDESVKWLSMDLTSGSIPAGASTGVPVKFNSKDLDLGTYYSNININSNDPLNPQLSVPCTFVVEGSPTIGLSATNYNFGEVFQNGSTTDTLMFFNTGCDTLAISNITSSLSEYTVNNTTMDIMPGDSAEVFVTFRPTTLGSINSILTVYNNDTDTTISLSGTGIEAPVISANPSLFDVTISECNDSITLPLTIYNTGGNALSVQAGSGTDSTSTQHYSTADATTEHTFTGLNNSADSVYLTITINGDFNASAEYADIYIEGSYVDRINPTSSNTDITESFALGGPNVATWLSDGQLVVSLDNSPGVNTGYGTMLHQVQLRIDGQAGWINLSAFSDTIQPGDSTIVDVEFNAKNLSSGTYNSDIIINSNDPINQKFSIPCTLTVDGNPTEPTSVTASNTEICLGESTILSYTGSSGTIFNWYTSSCGGTLVGSANNLTVSPTSTTTYYGRWENSCGGSACQSVTITVNDIPAQPSTISGASVSCDGATETYSVTDVVGVSYVWELPTGWTGSSTSNEITVTIGAEGGQVIATPSNSCGTGTERILNVSINNELIAATTVSASSAEICPGSTILLSHTGGAGTTFAWYSSSCGGTPVGTGNNLSVSPTATTTYYGRWENSCGETSCGDVTVTVNPVPTAPTSVSVSDTEICSGSSAILSYNGGAGNTFNWFSTSCGGTSVGSGDNLSVSPTVTTSYFGRWENDCGNSVCETVTVTVNDIPAQPNSIVGEIAPCLDAAVTYSTPSVNDVTYEWGLPSGWSGSSTTNEITVTVGSTNGEITVTPTNTCGTGTPQTLGVTPNTNITTITNHPHDVYASIGSYVVYTVVANGDDLTYQWRLNGSDITATGIDAYAASYQIPLVGEDDFGNYDVIVSGYCGNATSDIAVLALPSFVENIKSMGINMFPNPTDGKFILETQKVNSDFKVSVKDIIGKTIFEESYTGKKNEIDLSKEPAGIYFIQIEFNGEIVIGKLILK